MAIQPGAIGKEACTKIWSSDSVTDHQQRSTVRGRAQGLLEYGLVLALVALLAIAALIVYGSKISGLLSKMGGSV
jgi:hypothetical protein